MWGNIVQGIDYITQHQSNKHEIQSPFSNVCWPHRLFYVFLCFTAFPFPFFPYLFLAVLI